MIGLVIVILILLYFRNKGVPMFLYHQVNPVSSVTPELFEEHLKILKEKNMNTITLSEYGRGELGKNPFLITLDDGYYDNYTEVFPLLKKYNMKATIFLNTLYIGENWDKNEASIINGEANYLAMSKYLKTGDGTTRQYLSWDEIKEMHKSGLIDFQAHSHKHTGVFVSDKLEGVFDGSERDISELYLYHDIKEGYPKFPKRGEYASKGIIIDREFFEKFRLFYEKELKGKSEKEIIKLGQKFVDENKKDYFHWESDEEFEHRVKEEYILNRDLIESHLNKKTEYFCWPWGHRNKKSIEILKGCGVKGFVTTKKGTNGRRPNFEMIRRIELRKFTPDKFKLNLFVARNYILGKIYGWVS